jgi:hypothetical protein
LGFVKISVFKKNSSKLVTYNDVNNLALKMLFIRKVAFIFGVRLENNKLGKMEEGNTNS